MRRFTLIALLSTIFGASSALSSGWDTPILYSAEHMGMGGAAIAYADDPSAIYHNPAGLARTQGLTLMLDASWLYGSITSSPTRDQITIDSEAINSVAPLLGVSYKIMDRVAAGLAFYPVASSGATYLYKDDQGKEIENTTNVLFLEISPSLAFDVGSNIKLGVGYRASYVSLDRLNEGAPPSSLDFTMTGWNLKGLRVGLQWDPIAQLQLGLVYRHKTETEISDDDARVALPDDKVKASGSLVLPSKFGAGARLNLNSFSFVFDIEYTLQEQNERLIIDRDPPFALGSISSVFRWENSITLRGGFEYTLAEKYPLRVGYIYDGQATQKKWPSAFGTPPGASNTITGGFGYKPNAPWKINFALAYRLATAEVTQTDVDEGTTEEPCLACSFKGEYELSLFGTYIDFVYSFH
ncbi:outer membrane protein transport protein [Myxococcota bacterium]|nr:outer membrane protein transport protein [Myxococcota bacterium]MBU1900188.1 outer membrane protein transport protein [Myxococcota bacterium]